jgi:hypothetical protein
LALGKPHILVRQLKDLLCGLATMRVRAEMVVKVSFGFLVVSVGNSQWAIKPDLY